MTILIASGSPQPTASMELERAILETLAYSDVFDYPLRIEEIHRYLPIAAGMTEVARASNDSGLIECRQGFYFLAGREAIVSIRARREAVSRQALSRAMRIGRVLGRLPFIRMVALTGSLAVLNSDETADLDYFLITARGRVWMARGFALLLGRLTARSGYTLCPNLIVSEDALEWQQPDAYSAREICQMIPIAGRAVYAEMRSRNRWTHDFLPNASGAPFPAKSESESGMAVQRLLEWPLRGAVGDHIESWEMERKVRRFKLQAGFGVETHFGPDMCQGNFDHHGVRTLAAWQERLARIGIPSGSAVSRKKYRD